MPYFDLDPLLETMLDYSPGISDLNLSVGRPPQVELDGQLKTVAVRGSRAPPCRSTPAHRDAAAGRQARPRGQAGEDGIHRPLVQPGQAHALPRQRLRAARHLLHRPARHPEPRAHGRGARHPAPAQRDRQRAQRHRPRHRPHRLRQVHDPGRHHQQDQRRQAFHIITIEDPIEYLHPHSKSTINQREVGNDTQTSPSPCAPPCARRRR